jgi:membrane-bound metal-dependent hydrolase YbcI (DUF457 family)
MRGSTHRRVGRGATGVARHALTLDPVAVGALVIAAGVTSKLPDKLGARPGVTLRRGLRWLEHRRSSHWPETCAAFVVATGLLIGSRFGGSVGLVAAFGVAAGYGLHLLADSATPHGIPLGPLLRVVFRLVLRQVPEDRMPARYRKCWVKQRARKLRRPWNVHCVPATLRIVTGSRREGTFVFFWGVGCLCVLAFT